MIISPDILPISKEQKKKQEKQFKLDGKIHPHKNHHIFEINTLTGEIKKATLFKKDIHWNEAVSGIFTSGSVIKRKNCVYISALNEKTAIKKFKKGSSGTKFFDKEYEKLI